MKKAINIILYTLCVTTMFFLVSCEKGEDGAQGPAGPAGAPGPAGPAGPAGTANVIYSNWIDTADFLPITTTSGGITDTLGYFGDISAPKLTQDIFDKGEIKVYVKAGTNTPDPADDVVFPIPYNDGLIFIDPVYAVGLIELTSNAELDDVPFRYILIPGGEAARSPKSIDWNDYKQVQQYLGLKD